jgi:hypothetical protein
VGLFALCVSLKLNGSSIGRWQAVLKEPGPIRGLLLFKPQDIRDDEWCHITPSILAQARHSPPFPIENQTLGSGRSPLLMSLPVAYYTTFLRPQLWGFFIFDFEHAFAFYWCCKVFGLLLASAWLLRRIGINSVKIIAFGTVWIFFSSFVQWWFSSPAMLPEMLASWAMATGCALIFFSGARPFELALAVGGFVFFGANFVLCMYPGYQIPLLYLFVAILIGAWLQRRSLGEWRARQGLIFLGAASAALILLLVPLWATVHDTLTKVERTAYPGVFRGHGGALSVFDLFSGILGFFESEQRPPLHYDNICEASNFYPLWIVALLMMLCAKWRRGFAVPPLVLSLAALIVLIGAYCVIPMPQWFARGSFLGFAVEERLLLGIGMANILSCCLFFDSYREPIFKRNGITALIVTAGCFTAGILWLHPFRTDWRLSTVIVLINCAIVGMLIWDRTKAWFLPVFATLVLLNGAAVNPVMRGLSPLLESQAFQKIDQLRQVSSDANWLVYGDERTPQLVKATGASVLNGIKILPDLDLMHALDPDRRLEWIYNRMAYIRLVLAEQPDAVTFGLFGANHVEIGLPPEHPALRDGHDLYVVFPWLWINPANHGFIFVEKIEPADLYVFKLQPSAQ